jgi:hypothetical protein
MTMQVAVITPYYRESVELLQVCHDSVAAQDYSCRHVLVADGFPQESLDNWPVDHLRLPEPHHDIGSTPRLIGAVHAIGLGADLILFLDADNWYASDHVASVVACIAETGAAFVSCGRHLHDPDGRYLAECPNIDPERFVDTNCMAFARPAFGLLSQWVLMPPYAHLIGDRVMLNHVRHSGLPCQHLSRPSVHYRCGKAGIYWQLGLPLPSGVSAPPDYASSFRQWVADGNPPLP